MGSKLERRYMVKRNRGAYYKGLILVAAVFAFTWSVTVHAEKSSHPELTEQEMLVDCAECHKETTPDIEKEWFDSVHGLSMVKCYQCHGTFETFTVTPTIDNCATCHLAMTAEEHSEKKKCWECHTPHMFKAK